MICANVCCFFVVLSQPDEASVVSGQPFRADEHMPFPHFRELRSQELCSDDQASCPVSSPDNLGVTMSSCNENEDISLKRKDQNSNNRPEPLGKVLDLDTKSHMAQVWSVSDAQHLSHLLLSLLPSLPALPRISKWHPRPSLPGWCSSSASEPAFLWHLRLAKRTGHRLKTIKKQFASTDLFGAFPAWPFISAIHRVSTLHLLWGGGNYPWRIRPSITALETPGGSKIHIYIYQPHQ